MHFTVSDASRPESTRGQASLYSILLPRHRHCGCIPQSLRWRVLDPRTGEAQAADLGYVVGCTSSDTRSRGRMGKQEMAMTGKNRIMVYGPKNDGTYIVEFRTAKGETLAISIPQGETAVLKYFQERMPYGLYV